MSLTLALVLKFIFILVMLGLWLYTQSLLGRRASSSSSEIHDSLLEKSGFLHGLAHRNPKFANGLLISSSLIVDLLGLWILGNSLFGTSLRPLLCLLLVFALRQLNQAATLLPTPKGMIWRDPGVPSLFVTYGVSNDLFFSGHTALAVLGALEIASLGGIAWITLAIAIVIFEVGTVVVLRAHWTMDIFAGAITALWAHQFISQWAPSVDLWLSNL